MTSGEPSLRVRRTSLDDCTLLWQWANDPEVRVRAFHPWPIGWEEHCAWLERKLRDPHCHLYVVTDAAGADIGQIRFDSDAAGEVEVSISIAKAHRGKRYAAAALRLACEEFSRGARPRTVVARVKPENVASLKAFVAAGFVAVGDETVAGQGAVRMERHGREEA
jgi:RimJ/RimL family protein N-acetyltransferase